MFFFCFCFFHVVYCFCVLMLNQLLDGWEMHNGHVIWKSIVFMSIVELCAYRETSSGCLDWTVKNPGYAWIYKEKLSRNYGNIIKKVNLMKMVKLTLKLLRCRTQKLSYKLPHTSTWCVYSRSWDLLILSHGAHMGHLVSCLGYFLTLFCLFLLIRNVFNS